MPLMVMASNIAESDSPGSRKRSHEDYIKDEDTADVSIKTEPQHDLPMDSSDTCTAIPPHVAMSLAQSPPAQSSPAALTDTGCSTPADGPASPNTPTRQPLQTVPSGHNIPTVTQSKTMPPANTVLPNGQPPPKKKQKKLTPAEKAIKDAENAARKAEKEARDAEKEARKLAEEEKRKARQAEKDAAQAVREQNKKAKEEKRKEAEKKEREKQEEAERKARAQTKIGAFFIKKDPATPKPSSVADAAVKARSPSPVAVQTEYAKLALPFYVHSSVTMAKNAFEVDEETREAKTRILTEYIDGNRPPISLQPFDPITHLQLPCAPARRGKSIPSVREIMADHDGAASNPIDLIAKSLRLPTSKSLSQIPMKQFSFHEDVRPGYCGTVTSVQSVATLRKMARNPMAKDLPLNYDYDSEAEWVQGEEEEDEAVDDMTDDDEDEEDAKSIVSFLDDDDDTGRPMGRLIMGNMEPECSGICFEDRKRANPDLQMYKFRMEFLIPDLQHHHSIDPFSTAYWPSSGKAKAASSTSPGQDSKPNSAEKPPKVKLGDETIMPPPPAPSKTDASSSKTPGAAVSLIPAQHIDEFKAAVMEFKYLPKTALCPTLKKRFEKCTTAQIKATLEHVAEKHGRKDWELKPAS